MYQIRRRGRGSMYETDGLSMEVYPSELGSVFGLWIPIIIRCGYIPVIN